LQGWLALRSALPAIARPAVDALCMWQHVM